MKEEESEVQAAQTLRQEEQAGPSQPPKRPLLACSVIQNCGYLSSDEEADYLADVNNLVSGVK